MSLVFIVFGLFTKLAGTNVKVEVRASSFATTVFSYSQSRRQISVADSTLTTTSPTSLGPAIMSTASFEKADSRRQGI